MQAVEGNCAALSPARRLRIRLPDWETRSYDQLLHHYEVESELADRLRRASREERRTLYTAVYDEMFRRVPDHPMIASGAAASHSGDPGNLRFLGRFLTPASVYLEVGPGDCRFAMSVAPRVKAVHAVDVSHHLTDGVALPQNFSLAISDGTSIPVPEGSVDLAFSNQLMEHLHPDDAEEQLRNVFRALAPGGRYVCVTPNRVYGPSDQSMYFDAVSSCFHLREYSTGEIAGRLRAAGFTRITFYAGARGHYIAFPALPIRCAEAALLALPYPVRRAIAGWKPFRALLGVRVVAEKPLESRVVAEKPQ